MPHCAKCWTAARRPVFSALSTCTARTLRNAAGIVPGEVSRPDRVVLAEAMAHIAARHHITVSTCCEPDDFSRFGIEHGACIDPALIERISGKPVSAAKDPNQRENCLCAASTDIGAYDSCLHGCVYCYANVSEKAVRSNIQSHDPRSAFLIGGPRKDDIVTEKKNEVAGRKTDFSFRSIAKNFWRTHHEY